MSMRFVASLLAVLLTAGSVLADECPDEVVEDSGVRRAQAKKWFSKGEEGTKLGDDLGALKAFQCSMKFVPHGFTAFNIAQIAERVGDLELAIASYNKYLLLVPEAKDSDEINRKIAALKERLARVKQENAAKVARPAAAPAPARGPSASSSAAARRPDTRAGVSTETVAASTQDSETSSGPNYRTFAWISYGGAAAFGVGGVVTNLLSRSKMDSCRTKYNAGDRVGADSACSAAKPLAYTSYVMFGLGGAALAAGTFFVLRPTESSEVAMTPLPEGGLTLRYGGRF